MTKPSLPIEGSCRCGRVRLRISAQPILTMACHCSGCQKMSASAYSLSAAVPAEGFEVIEGEPVIGGLHGPDAHHYHCPHCKSWMFTHPEGMDWFVNLRPTMLDDAKWFSPFIETYTSEKLPWATTPAVHSYETFPPFEAYEGLVKEFAEKS
ncbi:GFA family protein [Neorhizobium huautlense]|uniref:GFA family protein n=1 Tax=Neorhizobium huautlense TaxID=67774 RepID=UPI000CF95D6B|nr:GFA family protein [Neorhizobium huautlense]